MVPDLWDEYFNWMYRLVCKSNIYTRLSFKKLLLLLDSIEFYAIVPMDDNRRIDGIDFRYTFGYYNGFDHDTIDRYMLTNKAYLFNNKNYFIDNKSCSVLEMMVALAFRIEQQITDNAAYGDRVGQWFWGMIQSLGLGHMDDQHFDEEFCKQTIDIFLKRQYGPNGNGGLFTVEHPPVDMTNLDIWCQCMWYLNETIYNEGEFNNEET